MFGDYDHIRCPCYPITIKNFRNCLESEAYERKMSKRKYVSGAQKRTNQHRKEQFNAKLPKISSIFLPNQREGAARASTGNVTQEFASSVITDITASNVGAAHCGE